MGRPRKKPAVKETDPKDDHGHDEHFIIEAEKRLTASFEARFARLEAMLECHAEVAHPSPATASRSRSLFDAASENPRVATSSTEQCYSPHTRSKVVPSTQPTEVRHRAASPSPSLSPQHENTRGPARQSSSGYAHSAANYIVGADRPQQCLTRFLPSSTADFIHDTEIDTQVQEILQTTAHQLASARGNVAPGMFPFKYILRGPEKKRATLNSVSLAEHLWGIFRILEEGSVDKDTKSALVIHINEVLEDAREFDWPSAVRRWSEEVFSQVAENRMKGGWRDYDRIQLLRMSLSRVHAARLSDDPHLLGSYTTAQSAGVSYIKKTTAANQDKLRGGPPCSAYNSTSGCHLPPGHSVNGSKQLHICSYCHSHLSASYQHAEPECRIKQKHAQSIQHFR